MFQGLFADVKFCVPFCFGVLTVVVIFQESVRVKANWIRSEMIKDMFKNISH
jgi:hypothetical protein